MPPPRSAPGKHPGCPWRRYRRHRPEDRPPPSGDRRRRPRPAALRSPTRREASSSGRRCRPGRGPAECLRWRTRPTTAGRKRTAPAPRPSHAARRAPSAGVPHSDRPRGRSRRGGMGRGRRVAPGEPRRSRSGGVVRLRAAGPHRTRDHVAPCADAAPCRRRCDRRVRRRRSYTPDVSHDLLDPSARRPAGAWIGAGYAQALAVVLLATGISRLMFPFFELANLILTYLLAIVVIATKYGRGPSVVTSVLSVAAFDFFFVPPYLTFAVADTQYLLTFAIMLVVGLVISGLTVRVGRQAEAARHREQRTAALYAMSRELAETGAADDLVAIAARHITDVFGADVAVLLPDAEGNLRVGRNEGRFCLDENDLTLSRWALEH